jgi:hypothetical protein
MARAAQENQDGPVDRLKAEAGGLVNALADRALSSVRGKVEDATSRLTGFAEGDKGPGLIAAATGARNLAEGKGPVRSLFSAGLSGIREKVSGMFGRGKGKGGSKKLKLTNIVETIDVGVPVRLAYDQWNQFSQFPSFMKKVENAERVEDTKLNWKAQVFWSHRAWESTIIDQHPDERIIWRSKGQKGHVDGAVTFHELGPRLTRIMFALEYHPQGLFERTGNIWRAQGRRVRLELKHFARHVMTNTALKPDDVEGWRGTIEDSEVVKDHETALREEGRGPGENGPQEPADEAAEGDAPEAPEDEATREPEAREPEGGDEEAQRDETADAREGNGVGPRRRRSAPARTLRADDGQPKQRRTATRGTARGGSRQ